MAQETQHAQEGVLVKGSESPTDLDKAMALAPTLDSDSDEEEEEGQVSQETQKRWRSGTPIDLEVLIPPSDILFNLFYSAV